MATETGTAFGIVVRFALYVDLMLLFGVPAFAIYAVPGAVLDTRLALRRFVPVAATIGLALSVFGIAILAASMTGTALAAVDLSSIGMVITATAAGTAWMVRIAALLAAAVLTRLAPGHRVIWPATVVCGALALSSLAWLGHGVMDDGRTGSVHLIADIGHLLAAGIWIGALAGLMFLLRPSQQTDGDELRLSHCALTGFATVGTATVSVLVATGLVNSWLLVGPAHLWSLGRSLYGQLLLAKLALFAGMLGLAAINRFWLTPALAGTTDDGRTGLGALRWSLALEASLAIGVLGLVAWLGTLEPPMSAM